MSRLRNRISQPSGSEPRFLAFFGRRNRSAESLDQPKAHPWQEAMQLVLLLAVFGMIGIVFFAHVLGK